MIWIGLALIALVVLLPLLPSLFRGTGGRPTDAVALLGGRESAMALYRGQIAEVERDRGLGLLGAEDYESARLEAQRRLLAADRLTETAASPGRGRSVLAIVALLPLAALALYLVNGRPSLPALGGGLRGTGATASAPIDPRIKTLIAQLTSEIAGLPSSDPRYAQGHALLGEVEETRGQTESALHDYRLALDARFSPELALRIAELQSRRDGHISSDSLALYRRALDAAPPDAPWRVAVEARIAEGEHQTPP